MPSYYSVCVQWVHVSVCAMSAADIIELSILLHLSILALIIHPNSPKYCRNRGRNLGAAAKADAIGEQQLKRMQLGSSRQSGRNRGAAAEADAIGEQQLKRTQSGSSS